MAETTLNKAPFVLRIATGTRANLKKPTAYPWQAEIALATDTGGVYICRTTEQPFQPLQTLNMALVDRSDGSIITDRLDGSIVYQD